jgi:hypothetical protein
MSPVDVTDRTTRALTSARTTMSATSVGSAAIGSIAILAIELGAAPDAAAIDAITKYPDVESIAALRAQTRLLAALDDLRPTYSTQVFRVGPSTGGDALRLERALSNWWRHSSRSVVSRLSSSESGTEVGAMASDSAPRSQPDELDQLWFWTSAWQTKEREADDDFANGRHAVTDSVEAFLAELDS